MGENEEFLSFESYVDESWGHCTCTRGTWWGRGYWIRFSLPWFGSSLVVVARSDIIE